MKIFFIDESGDANLSGTDKDYPVFVLGGVITEIAIYKHEIIPIIEQMKIDLFGRKDIILHTADIARNKNGFERMKDPSFRELFFERVNLVMKESRYSILACVINKKILIDKYGGNARDPYEYALHVLTERFAFILADTKMRGKIIAEKRNPQQDKLLRNAWENLVAKGTSFLPPERITSRIERNLDLRSKEENIIGLQLADLVVSPIGRNALGKKMHQDWDIIFSKLRRGPNGEIAGFGLIELPFSQKS